MSHKSNQKAERGGTTIPYFLMEKLNSLPFVISAFQPFIDTHTSLISSLATRAPLRFYVSKKKKTGYPPLFIDFLSYR
jgi:hypothetical protein